MMFKRILFAILIVCFTQGAIAAEIASQDVSSKNATALDVIFETSMGEFTLTLYPDKAPNTVANFLKYVDEGFYSNTVFHRAIPDFVVQGGGFEKGMKYKKPRGPIKNESSNRLKNERGTISMARKTHPDTATSQFYLNIKHNQSLDYLSKLQPGYTVFGKVLKGMEVIDKIALVPTTMVDRFKDVPKNDVMLISVKRATPIAAIKTNAQTEKPKVYVAGEHYVVLDKPVATRDSNKIEVVEMFSYGCPHCYELEPMIKNWSKQQISDVDFWTFPAVWNEPMKLYAAAFYAANELNVADKIHQPLFTAIVIEQKNIRNENDLANFFAQHGVAEKDFISAFNSIAVESQVKQAETRVRNYQPAGAPEIVVNGKYRIDRMRAGGYAEMLAVTDFLIKKERAALQ